MSVYNGSRYVEESIQSILGQTYANFEFIIIDDGSVDNTWKILTQYLSKDKRLVVLQNQENIGLTRSLNKALLISRGKYIARQDADDLSVKSRLAKQVAFLETNSEIILASSNYDRIDKDGKFIRRMKLDCDFELILWNLLFYNYLGGHSQVIFRRDSVLSLGGYSENFPYAQDYELWTRLIKNGQITIMPDILLKYRLHDNRLSNTASKEQLLCLFNASQKYLSTYLNRTPNLEEVASLWAFWTIRHPPPEFLQNSKSQDTQINKQLNYIFKQFKTDRTSKGKMNPYLSSRIRDQVAERYLKWAIIELFNKHNFVRTKKAIWHAIEWAGLKVPILFFRIVWNRLDELLQKKIR